MAQQTEIKEQLAEYAHNQWTGWMRYLFSKGEFNEDGTWTMPNWAVERWTRQMNTEYKDLLEEEKDSDRKEAEGMLNIFKQITMAQQTEFIPYGQALELKELGFDEECLSYYEGESFSYHLATMTSGDDYIIPAPLYQQAFRWFRDKKLSDMCICRYQSRDDGGIYYYYHITHDFGIEETRHFKEGFITYEEAELACLNELIEIVKNK